MPTPLVIDGLNCAVVTRDQYERTRAGGVDALNLTIVPPAADLVQSLSHLAQQLSAIAAMSDLATVVTSAADIEAAKVSGRVGVIVGAQNSAFIDHDPALVGILQRIGFRILQPTYMEQNRLGSGVLAPTNGGLTDAGRAWVAEMNRHRVLIDLSHVGYQTAEDCIRLSSRPVIFSHSNARALCDSRRNIPDALIKLVAERGGTVGVTLWPPMVRHERRPTLADYAAQVKHMVNLVGEEHVAFGSDLSEGRYANAEHWHRTFGPRGMYPEVTGVLGPWFQFEVRFTEGFESMAKTPALWQALAAAGLPARTIERVMGANLLRLYREVWGA